MAGLSFNFPCFRVGRLNLKFQVLCVDILERTQAVRKLGPISSDYLKFED